jgi:hypothetical protein
MERSWMGAGALVVAVVISGLGCQAARESRERTAFENASARRLAAAKAGLDSLAEELRLRADTSRVVWRHQLDSLEVERRVAQQKLEQLKTVESKRWAEIKGEMAEMIETVESGTDSLKTRLKH